MTTTSRRAVHFDKQDAIKVALYAAGLIGSIYWGRLVPGNPVGTIVQVVFIGGLGFGIWMLGRREQVLFGLAVLIAWGNQVTASFGGWAAFSLTDALLLAALILGVVNRQNALKLGWHPLFVGLGLLDFGLAVNLSQSVDPWTYIVRYRFVWLFGPLLFVFLIDSIRELSTTRRTMAFFAGGAPLACAAALWISVTQDYAAAKYELANATPSFGLGPITVEARIPYPMLPFEMSGLYFAFAAPIAWGLLATSRGWARVWWVLSAVACLVGMAISGSRTVLVAGVVSSLLAILLGSTGRRVRLSRLLPFALAVGLTAFLFTSVVANPDRQFLPRADLLSLYTFRLRVSNWEDALTLAQTSGFFGPGLSYRHPFWRQSFHNDFLQAWILFGIPGLIGMLWICAVGLGLAFRRLLLASWQDQRVLAAGLVGSLLAGWVVSMMHLPFFEVSAYYFWFVMGLIFCPAFAESKRSTPRWASEADSRASRR